MDETAPNVPPAPEPPQGAQKHTPAALETSHSGQGLAPKRSKHCFQGKQRQQTQMHTGGCSNPTSLQVSMTKRTVA